MNSRQQAILKIINSRPISDQSQLMRLLRDEGIASTQATISRDIKRLSLKKVREKAEDGTVITRYASAAPKPRSGNVKFKVLLSDSYVSVDCAGNIIVIKTHTGMAQAVCAAFDAMNYENVVGSLAGDDTIFIVCATNENAQEITQMLKKLTEEE